MNFLPEKIEQYSINHSQEEPLILKELTKETWQKIINPRMLSGAFQGRVLSMISKLIQPKTILEIGTYTGYSAICKRFQKALKQRRSPSTARWEWSRAHSPARTG